jgi:hypothetical protein
MAANDAIYNFEESPCIAWSAYCGPNGKAQTQWGTFVAREQINQAALKFFKVEADDQEAEGIVKSGIVRHPSQISFSSLEEAAILLSYGAFLEWRREKEVNDAISSMDHMVGFF